MRLPDLVTKLGDESGGAQHAHGSELAHIDDDCIIGFTRTNEAHDTVRTNVGFLEAAIVAIDGQKVGVRTHEPQPTDGV